MVGRIAFNVIASSRLADAANYGFDELMEHSRRYDRMEEFMDVCKALWNSVEPDAVLNREAAHQGDEFTLPFANTITIGAFSRVDSLP